MNHPVSTTRSTFGAWLLRLAKRLIGPIAYCIGILLSACIPQTDLPDVTGPDEPSDLTAAVAPLSANIFEGDGLELTATASGGTPPYVFRWDQNGGPIELELVDVQSASLAIEPFVETGRFVFRVVVSDMADHHAEAFVAVEVAPAVETDVPMLAVVGEPVELSADITAGDDADLRWQVTQGDATIADETTATTTLTAAAAETVVVTLTLTIPQAGGEPVTSVREFEIAAVSDLRPRVRFETSEGDFTLELDAEAAPITTANFLLYVDDGYYDGLLFHRNACRTVGESDECTPFVLQGGGFERIDDELVRREPTRDTIVSEADNGLTNGEVYSVAMALRGSDRDSAQTQFFVNLSADNAFLDDQGFTVFARVVEGTDVVDDIVAIPTEASPIIMGEDSLPVIDVVMELVTRG